MSFKNWLSLFTVEEEDKERAEDKEKLPGPIAYSANPQKWNERGIYSIHAKSSGPEGGYPEISSALINKQQQIKELEQERIDKFNADEQNYKSRVTPQTKYFGGKTKKRRKPKATVGKPKSTVGKPKTKSKNKKVASRKTAHNKKK